MTIGNARIYGLPDLFALPSTDIEAESEASADYPAEAMRSEVPTDTWRSAGYDPLDTSFKLESRFEGGIIPYGVGGVVLVNHNLWPWTGKVRFLFGQGSTPPTVLELYEVHDASSIVADTNTDNASFPSLAPSSLGLGTYVARLDFPTPSNDPSGKQVFMLPSRLGLGESLSPSEAPTFEVALWDEGVQIRVLAKKAVCNGISSDFRHLLFEWDASELTDPTGASVEIQVTGTINGVPSPVRYPVAEHVKWLCEAGGAVSGGPGILYDSGWLPAGQYIGRSNETEKYLPAEMTKGDCIAHDVHQSASDPHEIAGVNYVRVFILEDHSPDQNEYNVSTFPVVPPGYVEVGHVVGGGAVFKTRININIGPMDGVKDLSVTKFTQGGQQYGYRRGILRTGQMDFMALTVAEKAFITDRILRRRGTSRPLAIQFDPLSEFEAESLTFYATLAQQDNSASTQLIDDYRRRMTLAFWEYR